MPITVKLKKSLPNFNLKEGDILLVTSYSLDPMSKYTVIKRISDNFDPECNLYRNEVEVIRSNKNDR